MSNEPKTVMLSGHRLVPNKYPMSIQGYSRTPGFNKNDRIQMTMEDYIVFKKSAGGYVLDKNNKLRTQNQTDIDERALENVLQLRTQVKQIEAHSRHYDIDDVFNIVTPIDVRYSDALAPQRYHLLRDYPKLTPEMVANSNAWYSLWFHNQPSEQNLDIVHDLFQNNTENSLYLTCCEEEDTFHAAQRGGPLVGLFILHRIQNTSEQFLDHLYDKARHIRISKIEGENVDYVASLLKATYTTFESVSTEDDNRIPPEWNKMVISSLQTSSVPEFNEIFKEEERRARRRADRKGGVPQWPLYTEMLRMASMTYRRMLRAGTWNVPNSAKSKTYNVVGRTFNPAGSGSGGAQRPPRRCWNCGSSDHILPECDKPRDQAKIDRAVQEHRANNPRRRPNDRGNPRGRRDQGRRPPQGRAHAARPRDVEALDTNGRPLMINRRNQMVPDQRRIRAQRRANIARAPPPAADAPGPDTAVTSNPVARHAAPRTFEPVTVQNMLHGLS